jgi:hypothetical protein
MKGICKLNAFLVASRVRTQFAKPQCRHFMKDECEKIHFFSVRAYRSFWASRCYHIPMGYSGLRREIEDSIRKFAFKSLKLFFKVGFCIMR